MRTLIAILLAVAVTPTYELSFSIRGDRARGWPEKVKVTLTAPGGVMEKIIEAADVRREEIVVTHAGQGSKTIPLGSNLAAENDLGSIELPRGVTVKIVLERPYGAPKPLVVSLAEKRVVGTRELKPKETEATFNHI